MSRETPVLASVTETAAGDIEAAHLCGNGGDEEDTSQSGQHCQCAAIEKAEDQRDAAEHFQPRQIKSERYADGPWQNFVIVDVVSKLDWIERFNSAGIDKNCADDERHTSPDKLHF